MTVRDTVRVTNVDIGLAVVCCTISARSIACRPLPHLILTGTSKLHLSDEFASALMFGFRGEGRCFFFYAIPNILM